MQGPASFLRHPLQASSSQPDCLILFPAGFGCARAAAGKRWGVPQTSPQRIGLFGGTFDPVHRGHIAIAREARRAARLERIVLLPCRTSPHKTDALPPTPGDERLRMLALATAGLAWAEVSDFELRQPPPSWSWVTVRHFQELLPEADLFWILGADQWEVITQWARPETLRSALTFVVFPRPPHPAPQPRPGWRTILLDTVHPASATAVRHRLAQAGPPDPDLDPAVNEFVRRHGLYRAP